MERSCWYPNGRGELLLKFLCHVLQKRSDGQVLGADFLTFAALQAVGCLAVVPGEDIAVVIILVPVNLREERIDAHL